MSSSLLRLAFAIGSFYMAKTSSTPPRIPGAEEQKKYQAQADNKKDAMANIFRWWYPLYWTTVFLVNAVEVYDVCQSLLPRLVLPPLNPSIPTPTNRRTPPISILAFISATAAYTLRMNAIHHMGRQFTFLLSLGENHKLITDGPYSIVRHPGYLGAIAFCISNVTLTLGPGSVWFERRLWTNLYGAGFMMLFIYLNIWVSVIMIKRTEEEDGTLRREFDSQWDAWARQTPYRLIPFVY